MMVVDGAVRTPGTTYLPSRGFYDADGEITTWTRKFGTETPKLLLHAPKTSLCASEYQGALWQGIDRH
jgi:hypothetical protein